MSYLPQCVFTGRFPHSLAPTLCLLRRRVRLSREVADDVVRARGCKTKHDYFVNAVEESLFDGKKHGLRREWNENGARHELYYVDGKRHGLARWWYTNGALQCEMTYVANRQHGLSRWWHSNGACHWAFPYVDNKRHGLGRFWRVDGSLEHEVEYDHGRKVRVMEHHQP